MLLLLLMVVGAGLGMLIVYALRVPAFTSELNAWLGRTDVDVDLANARQAQLIFALFTYSAPMGLGILVFLLHYVLNKLERFTRVSAGQQDEDDEFRMEP